MNNIETLHTIYIVCMTAAIIMLVISIVLFFLFDIRHIIGRMLGFSEKKAIKEMEENNSFTSQLQQKYNVKMKDKVFTNSGSLKKNQYNASWILFRSGNCGFVRPIRSGYNSVGFLI